MTTATFAARPAPRRSRLLAAAASPWGWAVLAAVVVTALVVGSIRPSTPSSAARIASLESVIKCPPCDDLSIAQSDAGVSRALRQEVATLVHSGWSTPRIEARIESQYGTDEILTPPSGVAWVIPLVAVVLGLAAVSWVLWRSARRTKRRRASEDDEVLVQRAMDGLASGP